MRVAGQILQNMFWPAERRLGIHHPFLPEKGAQERRKCFLMGQRPAFPMERQSVLTKRSAEAGDELATKQTTERSQSLKRECIRPGTPLSLEDARRLVQGYVEHYNTVRLNSAIGYVTPKDMLARCQQEIHAERDRELEAARKHRQFRRQQAA